MNKIIITFLSGYIAVLLLGMLFYRFEIFNIYSPDFQFTTAGFIGAFLYPVYLYRDKKESYFLTFIIALVHFLIFQPDRTSFVIRDLIFISSVTAAVWIYVFFILPLISKKLDKLRIIALALIYCVTNIFAFLLLSALLFLLYEFIDYVFTDTLFLYMKYGLLIGFGLSIGFNFAEFIIRHYLNNKKIYA